MDNMIKVKVNNKEYDTHIDHKGVQRFIENSVICYLVANHIVDLNKLCIAYQEGKFSQKDYAEFNMMLGYSVCGFADLPSFEDYKIENPLWEKENK
jgi:hypothetical protein